MFDWLGLLYGLGHKIEGPSKELIAICSSFIFKNVGVACLFFIFTFFFIVALYCYIFSFEVLECEQMICYNA